MYTCDEQKWVNLTACWACMAVKRELVVALSTGRWEIARALQRNEEFTFPLSMRNLNVSAKL